MQGRREPLAYFLLLGVGVFALHRLAGSRAGGETGKILVTAGEVERLKAAYRRTWQRLPSETELNRLIEDHIRTEVLAREAIAMGLDRDDTIIRRHLKLRMESLAEDIRRAEPTEEELRAYLTSHADAFRAEPRYTFKQIYLNPDRRGALLDRDINRLLATLNRPDASPNLETLGDGVLLEHAFTAVTGREVAGLFGRAFAEGLSKLEPGKWQGPVSSGYGVHLVPVVERHEGGIPPFAEVREAVYREWTAEQVRSAKERFYQELRSRYAVRLDPIDGEKER